MNFHEFDFAGMAGAWNEPAPDGSLTVSHGQKFRALVVTGVRAPCPSLCTRKNRSGSNRGRLWTPSPTP